MQDLCRNSSGRDCRAVVTVAIFGHFGARTTTAGGFDFVRAGGEDDRYTTTVPTGGSRIIRRRRRIHTLSLSMLVKIIITTHTQAALSVPCLTGRPTK